MRRMMIALVPLALAACSQSAPPPDAEAPEEAHGLTGLPLAEEIAAGQGLAEDNCARCHGLGQEDPPRTDAPALRHLLTGLDSEAIKDDFREGIKIGHPDMPQFEFTPMETDMLLAYIRSIQEPETE
ncbi:MAG: cytochrome c [Hyphomonas sp.]|nr:cytochrome c [Hyphomonas sp.]